MAKNTDLPGQQAIPGINSKKLAYDGLLQANPQPTTMEDVKKFFRKYTITTVTWKGDHDFIRVVLKETDDSEAEEKHQYSKELPLDDPKEYEKRIFDISDKVYHVWIDLMAPKYTSPKK